MAIRSIRWLLPIMAVVAVACSAPAASPTSQPPAPAGAAKATAPAAQPAKPTAAAAQPAKPTAAAAAKPAAKPSPVSINYGHPVISSLYWHLFVGEAKGFYAEEAIDFKRTFVQAGYPAIAQGIVAGAYQAGSLGADTGIPAIENGADLVYVGGEMHIPVFSITTQPEIKSFSDIKNNKTVGAASVRGGTSMVLRAIFTMKGLKEGTDYTVIQAGSTSERVAALRNKTIDIGLMGQPQDFQMADLGFTSLGLTSDFLKDFGFAETWMKVSWAKANEDAVVRLLRAHWRAIDWLNDPKNKEEAIKILAEATKTEDKYARKTYELLIEKLKAFVPKAEPDEKSIDAGIKIMLETGELQKATVNGAKVTDKSYWLKVQESMKGR